MMHICICNLKELGLGNDLLPDRHQAITGSIDDLSCGAQEQSAGKTYSNMIVFLQQIQMKMASAKWTHFHNTKFR